MKSKTLYLHIGQPKTGSKWIQKIFSLNAHTLLANGIEYPIPLGEKAATQTINTFETNAQDFFSSKNTIQSILPESLKHQTHSVLLSAEVIFENIIKSLGESPEIINQKLQYINSLGFSEIHFLLLIRSPVERIVSILNQVIKTGFIESLPDNNVYSFLTKERSFKKVSQFLDFISLHPFCKLTLLNYDVIKDDMITPLTNWLQLPEGSLKTPEVSRINRSLSYEELYALTCIQGPARAQIPSIGFNWLRELPELRVKKMYPSKEIQEMIWRENEPYLERINAFLPVEQQLHKKIIPEFTPPEKLVFEPKQLDILIHFLTQHTQEKQPVDPPARKTFLQKCKRYIKKRISIR